MAVTMLFRMVVKRFVGRVAIRIFVQNLLFLKLFYGIGNQVLFDFHFQFLEVLVDRQLNIVDELTVVLISLLLRWSENFGSTWWPFSPRAFHSWALSNISLKRLFFLLFSQPFCGDDILLAVSPIYFRSSIGWTSTFVKVYGCAISKHPVLVEPILELADLLLLSTLSL